MGLIAPISSNHLLEIVSNEELLTTMLNVSGAGTAGALALSSVNHRMRELVLKHQPLQVNILSRALTARAFRIAGPAECIEFKMRDGSLESFETALGLAHRLHAYGPLVKSLEYVNNDCIPPILNLIKKRNAPFPKSDILEALLKRASSSAFDLEMSAFKQEYKEDDSYFISTLYLLWSRMVTIGSQNVDSIRNLYAQIQSLQARGHGTPSDRMGVFLELYDYDERKRIGEKGKSLFEIAQCNERSKDILIIEEIAIRQLEEDSPSAFLRSAFQRTIDILNLSPQNNHYGFFEFAFAKHKHLFHKINRLSVTNRDIQDIVNYMSVNSAHTVTQCYIESFFSEANSQNLLENYDPAIIDKFFEMSEPERILAMKQLHRQSILHLILAWMMKNKRYVYAWQMIVEQSKTLTLHELDPYLKQFAVKAATSNNPGALRYALALANTITQTRICASALFELSKNCKIKDLPTVPMEGSLVNAIAELANEWPRRKTFEELTRTEITKIGELLRPETATLETHAVRSERKKKIEKRTLLKQKLKTALQEIDQDSSSSKRAPFLNLDDK
jgi:hypothetical protein